MNGTHPFGLDHPIDERARQPREDLLRQRVVWGHSTVLLFDLIFVRLCCLRSP